MRTVKKHITRGCLLLSTLTLISCATTFGVPNEQWDKLDASQRKIVIENYYKEQAAENARAAKEREQAAARQAEIDKIAAKNKPITDAIAIANAAIESSKTSGSHIHTKENHKHCITGSFGETACGYNCYLDDFRHPHCANS